MAQVLAFGLAAIEMRFSESARWKSFWSNAAIARLSRIVV